MDVDKKERKRKLCEIYIPVFCVLLNLFLEVCDTFLYAVLLLRASTAPLGQMEETMGTKASCRKNNLPGICIQDRKKNIIHREQPYCKHQITPLVKQQ